LDAFGIAVKASTELAGNLDSIPHSTAFPVSRGYGGKEKRARKSDPRPSESRCFSGGSVLGLLRHRSRLEEIRKVGGMGRVLEVWADVENVLPSAQIGRVRIVERARVRQPVDVGMRALRDDDFPEWYD
jgi:hypothetical protein